MDTSKLKRLYRSMLKKGKMPCNGLCNTLLNRARSFNDIFFLCHPCFYDRWELIRQSKDTAFWGANVSYSRGPASRSTRVSFTPLRQNLLLLLIEICEGETEKTLNQWLTTVING